jgi:archaellum component FlaC
MEEEMKGFVEKVKEELKRVRDAFEGMKNQLTSIEARVAALESQKVGKKKDEGWF